MPITPTEQSGPKNVLEQLQRFGPPASAEECLDSIFEQVLPYFNSAIDWKARKIINLSDSTCQKNDSSIFHRALVAKARLALKEGLRIYLFRTQGWKNKVPIDTYLFKVLCNFEFMEIRDNSIYPKINRFVCLSCKEFQLREELLEFSEGLNCPTCVNFIADCDSNPSLKVAFQSRYRLSKLLLGHSRGGVRCPRCQRFVPVSLRDNEGKLTCPYEKCGEDCSSIAEKVSHPVGLFNVDLVSLENKEGVSKSATAPNMIKAQDRLRCRSKSVEMSLECLDAAKKSADQIKQIIEKQKAVNGSTRAAPNKKVMYDSIHNVLDKYPLEAVNFLTRKTKINEIPMQAVIFQEFSKNMLNLLPLQLEHKNQKIKIEEPTDEHLHLFSGIAAFNSTVEPSLIVKKPTVLLKNRDSAKLATNVHEKVAFSFMGHIIFVMNEALEDITENVDSYSFSNLRLKQNSQSLVGQKIFVMYYTIPAHYSMQSMAHLRRIAKRIYQSCLARKL